MEKLDLSFYKNKKVLLTGHTGFKGSWLSLILLMAGANVVGYSLEPPTKPSLFNILKLDKKMVSHIGDIRDYEHLNNVFNLERPEIVFHLAAQPIVLTSYKEPKYTFETNVMGTVNLLECCRASAFVKSVLNVTTDKVYHNPELASHGFKEDEPLDGDDPYSNSKSCSELVTHSYKKSFFDIKGVPVSTARAGNVIGGGDFADNRIIPDAVRAIIDRKPVYLRHPNSVRPYQHVLEPLYVYLMLVAKQTENFSYCGYYNVGPDISDCVSSGELIKLFASAYGPELSYEFGSSDGPHEANFLRLDCQKLKETFSWKPQTNIEEALALVAEWTKAYLEGSDEDVLIETEREISCFFNV